MDWPGMVIAAMFGAAFGSFINVVADRLPAGQSLVTPPSHCPVCGYRIRLWDLFPVFSYTLLRGKCRSCRSGIPVRVLLVEIAMAALFAGVWAMHGMSYQGIAMMGYVSLFMAVFIIDLEHQIIPNRIVVPGLLAALAVASFWPELGPVKAAIGAGVGFAILLVLYLIPGSGMGEGDVKLAAVIGAATGFPVVVVSIGLSFMLGGAVAGALLATGRKRRKSRIPFGPYLAVATLVGLGWGDAIWRWYVGTFTPF